MQAFHETANATTAPPLGQVLNLGGSRIAETIVGMLKTMFIDKVGSGRPLMPTAPLYNDEGMNLWEQITHLPKYYQTRDEISLLDKHANESASHVVPGSVLLDIGSGEARKIRPFLDALENLQIRVKYFALDLSKPALEKSMRELVPRYKFVECHALWGTFQDAFSWAQTVSAPLWIISLGSFFGNDHFPAAISRLSEWSSIMRSEDRMLLGMDSQSDTSAVWNSYHDEKGLFEKFMRDGFLFTNQLLGTDWYRNEDWEVSGRIDSLTPITHTFVFRAKRVVECPRLNLKFAAGDEIDCYEVFKYGPETMRAQFAAADLLEIGYWQAPDAPFYEYLLRSRESRKTGRTRAQAGRL